MAQPVWCKRCGGAEVAVRADDEHVCGKCGYTWRTATLLDDRVRLLERIEKAARAHRKAEFEHGYGSETAVQIGYLLDDALSTFDAAVSEGCPKGVVST